MKNRLLKNTVALGAMQIASYIAPFVVLVHLTKTLGLDLYGVLAFVQGIIALSFVLLDFGFSLSATNKISKYRNNKKYIAKLIGGIAAIKVILFFACCILVISYSLLTEKYSDHKYIFWLSLVPIAMQGFLPFWFFHGIEKMKVVAFVTVGAKLVFVIAALAFVRVPSDYYLVPLLNGVSQFVALLAFIFFMYKMGYKIIIPNIRMIFYCFKITRQFFLSRIAVSSYLDGGIIVLGLIAQPTVVAIYSMAQQLYIVMQSFLAPVAAAAYPYMTKEKDVPLMFKMVIGVVAIAFIGACVGYYAAPFLVELVFDKSWLAAIPVLDIFLFAIVIHAAAVMTGYPLAAIVGRLDVANSSVVTGAGVYFVLLAIAFALDLVSPINLAAIMLISELCVFLHRSIVLIPMAIEAHQISKPQGKQR